MPVEQLRLFFLCISILSLHSLVRNKMSNPQSSLLCCSVAAVKDIDRYQEKITVSLQQASLSPSLGHIKLGVVAREELPIHYRYTTSTTCHDKMEKSIVLKNSVLK